MKKLLLLVALLLPLAAAAEASDPTIGVPNPIYAANQVLAGPEATQAYAEWLVSSKVAEGENVAQQSHDFATETTELLVSGAKDTLRLCSTYGVAPPADQVCGQVTA